MDEKIIYTYGVFDLLHPGHVILLERAKALGSFLIVGIVDDKPVKNKKGNDRPIMPVEDRLHVVSSLRCVDRAILQKKYDPSDNLRQLVSENHMHIHILAKGDDWDYIPGTETIEKLGGCLVKLPYSNDYSTTEMVKKVRKGKK